ncbi:hypothetical protein [Enteractinococcus helveticum]|uniref:Uncharacterized protein n=1 Tax=Enteractinococcus helveticum TaxID=1837282 RepID=A0A1B7M3G3_9MICC|nr:hypothetical protein [Enteractinococcus helveticum]OAV63120.1 hypothetical protein A6F49_02910 [Enteractinococcus helveticum]
MMHTFFCTDKGRHKRRDVGTIQDGQQVNKEIESANRLLSHYGYGSDALETALPNRLVERTGRKRINRSGKTLASTFDGITVKETKAGHAWAFTCSTCGRSPRVDDQQLQQLLEAVSQGQAFALDISNWAQ